MSRFLDYRQWTPGLLHGERTFNEVLGTLPGIKASAVPAVIRFFENPSSGWALPGAITLARHDCIHVLLGRGLNTEDEAFVIGFTMDSSDGVENRMTRLLRGVCTLTHPGLKTAADRSRKLRDMQIAVFRFVASRFYPGSTRFSRDDLAVYDMGLALGESEKVRNLEMFPFEDHMDRPVRDIRRELGIDILKLEAIYRVERMLTNSDDARRLDTDESGPDHSHLEDTEGPEADWAKPGRT